MPLKWTPEKFKKQLVADLKTNGQVVGELVRNDARRRLRSITDPDWGAEYRSFVAGLVTYEIKSSSKEVAITVGVKGGRTKWHGFYIETGTTRRAAHPWLRPAVFENGKKIVAALEGK